MATMSVSGVVSGMDWDSMIDTLIEKAAKPAQVQVAKRTNLQNKKSLFEEMKVMVQSIQTSMTSLKLPSTYKAKAVDIERLDSSGSYKGVLTATVNADAEVNVYDIVVQQLATAQTNRSKQITSSTIASTLSSGGISSESSKMYINAGGQKVGIDVYATDSLQSLKSRINTVVKSLETPLNVTASVVDNKLMIKSDNTGLGLTTTEETVRYNANGISTLQTISPDSSGTLTVRSGSTTYTEGKDYVIAGNHQIRWKQYDNGPEVALGGKVNATYTMGTDDVYTTSGTYGKSEASIDFTYVDGGDLSSRLRIVDEDKNTYAYGKDFTLKNNKVVWLDNQTYTNGEPSAYTVTLKKTTTTDADVSMTRSSIPSGFTLSYTGATYQKTFDVNIPATGSGNVTDMNFDELSSVMLSGGGVFPASTASYGIIDCIDGYARAGLEFSFKLDSAGQSQTYSYGDDFIIWNGDTGARITKDSTTNQVLPPYVLAKGIVTDISEYSSSLPTDKGTMTVSYTPTYKSPDALKAGETCDTLESILAAASGDYEHLVLTDKNGKTYTYGEDYTVDADGNFHMTNDAIKADDFSEIETAYRAKYNISSDSALPTITIEGSDGVLRTYLDPDDRKALTMTSGTKGSDDYKEYEYGRDYVIRVNDDGDGYVFSWLVTGDANDDGVTNIKDANVEVTAYTAKKGISTSGWLAAPDTSYKFSLSGTSEETKSVKLKSTSDIKNLAELDLGFSSADLANLLTASSDSDGVVSFKSVDGKTEYELTIKSNDSEVTYSKVNPSDMGSSYSVSYYIDSSGNIAWNNDGSSKPTTGTFKVTYQEDGLTVTTDPINFDGNTSLLDVLARDSVENLPGSISITDTSGNTYTLGTDFKLNTDGTIHWLDDDPVGHPAGSYSLEYDAYAGISVDTYSTSDTTTAITGFTDVTYSDILSDAKVSEQGKDEDDDDYQARVDTALAKIFTLTDGTLDEDDKEVTYVYGTDYRIIAASSTDDSPVIEWISGGSRPVNGVTLNIDYTGRGSTSAETLTDTVTRSASDSVIANSADYDATTGIALPPKATTLQSGTTTITYGNMTFYEGEDYDITADSEGYAQITWIADSERDKDEPAREWSYPTSGSMYTINHVDGNGNTKTYSGYRTSRAVLDMADLGINVDGSKLSGTLSVSYNNGLPLKYDDTLYEDDEENKTANDAINATYSFKINETTRLVNGNGNRVYEFNWQTPTRTTHEGLPAYGADVTVEYEYEANSFTLSDDGDGLIDALGLNDEENVTDAHNAVILLDGEEVQRDKNILSADENTEVIKGMVINLKGLGEVNLDVYHDAEKAVTSINTFKDSYNDLMSWMNTRMTESAVDNDTAATIDSDDFRMRWGLLHGNALLRQTKSQMRNLTSQTFSYSFTQRTSASEVYGTMQNNGLRNDATLRIRIGGVYSDLTIQPYQSLQDIVDMINDSTNTEMRNMYYDTDGKLLEQPRIKASISDDKLVISSTGNDAITLSGTSALNALKMNYTYTGLFQLGIATTSTDYGKSGELEFDESKFMESLEDNPDEVQELMLMFANDMDTWLKGMLTSSASGETSGTLTRQIEDLETQISNIDDYLEKYQDRLDRQEEALRSKFAAAEQNLSKLSQQASSMAAILTQLSNSSSNSNSSSS